MDENKPTRPRGIPRFAVYIDVGEMISGILLIIFVFFHLFLVFMVVFGEKGEVFDKLAKFLEDYYLFHIALIGVALLILAHAVLVISRVPLRIQDQIEVLRRGTMMKHFDTLLWFFQAGSGFLIFAFAFAQTFPRKSIFFSSFSCVPQGRFLRIHRLYIPER